MGASTRGSFLVVLAVIVYLLLPAQAEAYIGPGVGVTAIGTVIGLVGAILFAIIGFVWYPVKRLLAMFRRRYARHHEAQKASAS